MLRLIEPKVNHNWYFIGIAAANTFGILLSGAYLLDWLPVRAN